MSSVSTLLVMSENFFCVSCNVHCSTERAYKNHLRSNKHRDNVGLPPQRHPCPRCHKPYSRRSEVKRHLDEGKCAGSDLDSNTGASRALKHELSLSSDNMSQKFCRLISPDEKTTDEIFSSLDPEGDKVNFPKDDTGAIRSIQNQIKSRANHSVQEPHARRSEPGGHFLPEKLTMISTHDIEHRPMQLSEADSSIRTTEPLVPETSEQTIIPRGGTARALGGGVQNNVAEAVVKTLKNDLARSMSALSLSVIDEVSIPPPNELDNNPISRRTNTVAPSLRSLRLFSTGTDSKGSLFGHPEAGVRTPDFMRSSLRSLRRSSRSSVFSTGTDSKAPLFGHTEAGLRTPELLQSSVRSLRRSSRSSMFSIEMPAPMCERIDDELRWARESHRITDYTQELLRETNGLRLIRDAREGNHQSVYDNLMHSDVDINYCPASDVFFNAASEAYLNDHVKVLIAIVRAFTSTATQKHSKLILGFLSGDQGGLNVLDHMSDCSSEWYDFDYSLRIMIATVSCLCPQEVRSGTICERVALGQSYSLDAIKSECLWGDKLLRRAWPNMYEYARSPTKILREFLRSLKLDGVFFKSNEHTKTQAHKIHVRAAFPSKEYARLEERKLEIGENLYSMAPDREYERYRLVNQELQRLRFDESWQQVMKETMDINAQHDLLVTA
jgi:hypothetical protein